MKRKGKSWKEEDGRPTLLHFSFYFLSFPFLADSHSQMIDLNVHSFGVRMVGAATSPLAVK